MKIEKSEGRRLKAERERHTEKETKKEREREKYIEKTENRNHVLGILHCCHSARVMLSVLLVLPLLSLLVVSSFPF